ncbi:hypothetical protein OPQ81_002819 [Rhizoctonia solani]|nr:hypothetical protein OPQ81_002819 [Rhizoctonia solani]
MMRGSAREETSGTKSKYQLLQGSKCGEIRSDTRESLAYKDTGQAVITDSHLQLTRKSTSTADLDPPLLFESPCRHIWGKWLSRTSSWLKIAPQRRGKERSFHSDRFDLLGEPNDIDKAIEYTTLTLTLISEDNINLPCVLNNLGGFYCKRFQRLREGDDCDKAIEYASIALALTPDRDPDWPSMHANLGASLRIRFERLGELFDLERAIEYESQAVALTPDDHPELSGRLAGLGISHSYRFQHLGELCDIEKAIDYKSRALRVTPEGHPDLSSRLASLGISHSNRFRRLGEIEDLGKAIEYESRGLALTPESHADFPSRLANLGISHGNRFRHLGELGDLEKAIEYKSRALTLTPADHPAFAEHLHGLGTFHGHRFRRLGELGDLEKSVEYKSRALGLTPEGHLNLSSQLSGLGESYTERFVRLGDLEDLEKAIEYQSRALSLLPHGHPASPARLQNLGVSHIHRFMSLSQLGDLEKAIEYQSRALVLTPEDHPDFAERLQVLGVSYIHRFEFLGKPEDGEKAIQYQSQALALTPDTHPEMSTRLYNLGMDYENRFEQRGEWEDLEKVIECMSCALELTPDGHPTLLHKHFPLATSRFFQYKRTGDLSQLQESLHSFRAATQSLAGSPRDKFRYAMLWAEQASKETSLSCLEAYQTAIDLLPQFIWLGATTTQRYHDLKRAQNLAISAGYAAIISSRYGLALEWLEHARCVVWNQNLMLRSPLDQLITCDPGLATRLQTVAVRLHHAGSQSRESQVLSSGLLSHEQAAQQHRELAKEYDDLITEARTLPGFEDFLQPLKANRLVHAAQNRVIVVINGHDDQCDALAITPGQDNIAHIPLSSFTGKKAQLTRLEMEQFVRNSRSMERAVERRPPVLDFLGYTKNTSNNSLPLPHITWCPTGALSFLPLHAAGDYDQPQSRVFDYVISSYTPTLTALLSSAPSSLTPGSRVLAIGQPNTPGHSSLPGTAQELAYLKDHMSGKVEYSQLMDDQATTTAVLDAMEQHDWVHLACHAHQNVQDPTKSGFFLHDDILDLASINQRSFKGKGLAYLSACQTATGDKTLPDEAIHLASGMLMAGYSSVIATMWSVMDDDAPFVADKVYSQLMRDGTLGKGEAGKALHYAVEALREKVGEKEFRRWVPYIHIGS